MIPQTCCLRLVSSQSPALPACSLPGLQSTHLPNSTCGPNTALRPDSLPSSQPRITGHRSASTGREEETDPLVSQLFQRGPTSPLPVSQTPYLTRSHITPVPLASDDLIPPAHEWLPHLPLLPKGKDFYSASPQASSAQKTPYTHTCNIKYFQVV